MIGEPQRGRRVALLATSFATGAAVLIAYPAYADELPGPIIWFTQPNNVPTPQPAPNNVKGNGNVSNPTPELRGRTVVYLVAHQDDEVLSLGASVANEVTSGAQVKIVSIYDGSASSARQRLCEIKKVCLTHEQFGVARRNEFKAAVSRLGVPASSVFFDTVPEDTGTPAKLNDVVEKYVNKFGTSALYRTMSFMDAHRDHYSLGYALEAQCQKNALADCMFFQSDLYRQGTGIRLGAYSKVVTPRGHIVTPTPLAVKRLRAAMAEYKVFDVAKERYAIGWTYSVPAYFAYASAYPEDWAHGPRSQWSNAADRLAGEAWMSLYQQQKGLDLVYPSQKTVQELSPALLKSSVLLPAPKALTAPAKAKANSLGKATPKRKKR